MVNKNAYVQNDDIFKWFAWMAQLREYSFELNEIYLRLFWEINIGNIRISWFIIVTKSYQDQWLSKFKIN